MNILGKIVTGHVPDSDPSTSVQICYLKYTDKRMCCSARMTKIYKLNMLKIIALFESTTKRYLPLNEDISSAEHELWHYDTLKQVLGKSAPYTSNNVNELTIYEWNLSSSVLEAFIFNKMRFDFVTVIIENKMEHWFGIKTSSDPVFTYRRSRPRTRNLQTIECCELPQSPIVLAANNPNYKCKCDNCGECNQKIMPMETYVFKRMCTNQFKKEHTVEPATACAEVQKLNEGKFSLNKLFKRNSVNVKEILRSDISSYKNQIPALLRATKESD